LHNPSGKNLEKYLENLAVVVGLNQSFYGTDWNDAEEDLKDDGTDVDHNLFRKLSFTIISEHKNGILGGAKYLSYGFDYDFERSNGDYYVNGFSSNSIFELKFFKLFLTYPSIDGLYLGFEELYFIEGESKLKMQNGPNDTNDIDKDI
tara:strand:- start:409 stop:852 length:444 start_codon:yes stop_codon:yes gene_type:complete